MGKEEILKKVKKVIFKVYPSATIILYGSRARGDFRKYSDWDLLVLVRKQTNENQINEIFDNLFELELESDQIFSPIIHNVSEWEKLKITSFYQNVQNEGIQI
ncbi:MAG: nucleotidyltransferase domain-containing protein [Candidatus Cloacimonetes bacterium]|nr:nucleotidyltransferase domain-containing protein [Candidatus Cloacimonadota bacterium]